MRFSGMKTGIGAAVFFFGTSVSGLTTIQAGPDQLKKPLEYRVSVSLKLIQVSVTDRKGRPITDLTLDDFIVTDNGKPVALSVFEKHAVVSRRPPADTPVPGQEPEQPKPRAVESPAPSISRKFLLFFDFAFNTPKGVEKAMTTAVLFLDKIAKPGDEVGLVSFSLFQGMKIHEFFTADLPRVRKTLSQISSKSAAGRFENMEAKYWTKWEAAQLDSAAEKELKQGMSDDVRGVPSNSTLTMQRGELKAQVQLYLSRLADIASALRIVPGQKNLIMFSTGIPNTLIHGLAFTGTGRDEHLRVRLEETMGMLSSANVAFYGFDTREQGRTVDLFRTDEETFGTGYKSRNMTDTESFNIVGDERLTGRNTLERFADRTGGQYFGNIREHERNLDRIQNMTGTYYVLGYPIEETADGAYRKIEVETKRKGAVLHAQTGYFNPKPFAEYSKIEKDLHLFDLAYSERPQSPAPLPAGLSVLAVSAESSTDLVYLTRLPPETVEKLAGGVSEIVTFVFDKSGELVELERFERDLAPWKDKVVCLASGARLDPGSYQCRVVVRNLATGAAAAASARAFLPEASGGEIRLQTPLLLLPGEASVYLPARTASASQGLWPLMYSFDADRYSPIAGPIARGTPKILVLLPCVAEGIESPQVRLRSSVVDVATGRNMELTAVPLATVFQKDFFVQPLELPCDALPAGQYTLRFQIEDVLTRSVNRVSVPLTIR